MVEFTVKCPFIVCTQTAHGNMSRGKKCINPLSPKIDFDVDLLICETYWASNHKFIQIFQETYYL